MDLQERYDKEYIKMREFFSKTTILNENGEYKARQKQNLIDMMESDEKLGLYQKPTKFYTIEDIERCVENWGLCKVEREYIEKFLATDQNKDDNSTDNFNSNSIPSV